MSRIANAMMVAVRHHEGQVYGKGTPEERPFLLHAVEVASVALEFLRSTDLDFDPEDVCVVGLLHDVIEDSEQGRLVAAAEVLEAAGPANFDAIDRLTDVEAPSRAISKPLTQARIAQNLLATLVKLSDRFVNQRATIAGQSKKHAKMYVKEYESFKGDLFETLPDDSIWGALDGQFEDMRSLLYLTNEPLAPTV